MDAYEPLVAVDNHARLRIAGDLVSIAGLRGRIVFDRTGRHVGRLADLVVRLDPEDPHPPIQGALVRAGSKLHYIPETAIAGIRDWNLFLCTVGLTSRAIPTNDPFVRLAHHVRLSAPSRVSDIILACSIDGVRLVGIDTSVRTLLRRFVPSPIRRTVSPRRLQPWPLLDAPKHSKSPETSPPVAPPRLASPLIPRAGRPTSTPPYTPYTRRTCSPFAERTVP